MSDGVKSYVGMGTGANPNSHNINGYDPVRYQGINDQLPDAYYNDLDTPIPLKREKAAHRLMIFMHANGYNITEIAEKTEYSAQMVSRVLRQPWAKAMVQAEQRAAGSDGLKELFRDGAMKGYERILTLMDKAESENVQADCAKYAINRFFGQPTQPIESVSKAAVEMTDDELRKSLEEVLQPAPTAPEIEPTGEAGLGITNGPPGITRPVIPLTSDPPAPQPAPITKLPRPV